MIFFLIFWHAKNAEYTACMYDYENAFDTCTLSIEGVNAYHSNCLILLLFEMNWLNN